jgi:hypothetical protein
MHISNFHIIIGRVPRPILRLELRLLSSLSTLHPLQVCHLFYLLIGVVISIRFDSRHDLLLSYPEIVHFSATVAKALTDHALAHLATGNDMWPVLVMALYASIDLVLVLDVNRVLVHYMAINSGHGHLCQVWIEALRWLQVNIWSILTDFCLLLFI